MSRDPYDVLGVNPEADIETIRRHWKIAMRRAHPDVGGTHAAALEVQEALFTLSDPLRRAELNRRRRERSEGNRHYRESSESFNHASPGSDGGSGSDVGPDVDEWIRRMSEESARIRSETARSRSEWAERTARESARNAVEDELRWERMSDTHCRAWTKSGSPCFGWKWGGTEFCHAHQTPGSHGPWCARCGVRTRLRGQTNCIEHSSPAERRAAERATPARQCISTTKGGKPCMASPVQNGLCHFHGVVAAGIAAEWANQRYGGTATAAAAAAAAAPGHRTGAAGVASKVRVSATWLAATAVAIAFLAVAGVLDLVLGAIVMAAILYGYYRLFRFGWRRRRRRGRRRRR